MWITLSVLTAFFYAAVGAWNKKITEKVNYHTATWSMFAFAVPFLAAVLLSVGVRRPETAFYPNCLATLMLNMVGTTLFVKAITISPLSVVFPFLAFTPLFLIFTGFVFLGEMPGAYGIAGIMLIVSGTYVMGMSRERRGIFAPFVSLRKEKGALLMIIVAFIWSFAVSFDKRSVLSSSPVFFMFAFNAGFTVMYLPFVYVKNPGFISEIRQNLPALGFLGFLMALLFICQMNAVKLALVSYVISIKRAGMLFTLLFGWIFFKEKLTVYKTAATVLMLAGTLLITLKSR
ncbi:MAG: EamA family transporter [Elusimicrobia bacterium]|nr:EamA family transporter [Elusimicrobiota bacterium]